jgi:hypothetical protein
MSKLIKESEFFFVGYDKNNNLDGNTLLINFKSNMFSKNFKISKSIIVFNVMFDIENSNKFKQECLNYFKTNIKNNNFNIYFNKSYKYSVDVHIEINDANKAGIILSLLGYTKETIEYVINTLFI